MTEPTSVADQDSQSWAIWLWYLWPGAQEQIQWFELSSQEAYAALLASIFSPRFLEGIVADVEGDKPFFHGTYLVWFRLTMRDQVPQLKIQQL